jgi:predicted transcriptional regulator
VTDHDTTTERALPADINAERATLGSCLLERDAVTLLAAWLPADAFYLQKHTWIYQAILACYYKRIPPDIATVADELRRRDQLDRVGGYLYLGELTESVPTAVHVEYYARIVSRAATMRRLIETGGKISVLGYNEQAEIDRVFDQVHDLLSQVERERGEHPRVGRVCDLMNEEIEPIHWVIPGLLSQGFGFLAAQPGTGKTWMLLQWAMAIASGGHVFGHIKVDSAPVLFLALEDNKASLQERIRTLGYERIPEGFYYSTMDEGWNPLDDGGITQLENAIIATAPALVVIDTLTAVSPDSKPGGNPYRAEYQSYIPVRRLADEYGCAIIGSWHFNKANRSNVLEMTSGTMGLPAVSVNRIGLVREQDSDQARIKSHSKRGKEADWALQFDMTTCQWVYQGETREHQMSEQRKLVLAALEEQGVSAFKDLLDVTGMEYNNLLQLMRSLKKSGVIQSAGKGLYKLPDEHDRQD